MSQKKNKKLLVKIKNF